MLLPLRILSFLHRQTDRDTHTPNSSWREEADSHIWTFPTCEPRVIWGAVRSRDGRVEAGSAGAEPTPAAPPLPAPGAPASLSATTSWEAEAHACHCLAKGCLGQGTGLWAAPHPSKSTQGLRCWATLGTYSEFPVTGVFQHLPVSSPSPDGLLPTEVCSMGDSQADEVGLGDG